LAAVAAVLLLAACGRAPSPELVRLPDVVPDAVLIRNVAVLDVDSGDLAADRDVLVVGDRIATVTAAGEHPAPEGAATIDGSGATLLPGLIDMHGHIGNAPEPSWLGTFPDPERNLRSYLYSGVTTVLDPADLANQAFERREKVAAGELLGPTIYTAGPRITAPGGHPVAVIEELAPWWIRWYLVPRFTREVATPEEAREVVREVAGLGADVIKLSVDRIPEDAPRIRDDVLTAAADEARQQGVRPVAHIGSLQDAIDAAEAGVALWVHGVYKERIPDDKIEQLAGYGIPMVATMYVFESYALLGQGPREPTKLERETVSPDVLAAFDDPPDEAAAGDFQDYLESLHPLRPAWRDNVRRLREAGVTILAGSDAQMGVFPGPGLHRELQLLTEAGLTPAETIRAATLDAARFLEETANPDFGVIAPGKRADLLLVDGDPTADLDALSDIRAVIKNGIPLERTPI
jgi:imidazolonepropionase-like amidohydrolase